MKIKTRTKSNFTFLFIANFLLIVFQANAQQFQLASGPISNTLSDSRSVNFFDINNDGWEDIFVSNGLNGGQADLLYINDGTGQFIEATNQGILLAVNPSDGASFADYNNDGHIDGVVSSWYGAEDLLYLNNGNATLNYYANAGIASGSFGETAAFGDYNNDGWVDLYITNSGGNKKNYLYKNLQNGSFEQITNHILVNNIKLSRGAIWGDFNNDNITDLFVANESNIANDIYYGTGGGNFEKLTSGDIVTSAKGSMTGSWGDIDNDGDFDLFVGNAEYFLAQPNQLFFNNGNGFVEEMDDPVVTANKCTYGSAFGDYDNDGDLDLIVSNGFCNLGLNNNLYENQGDGTFIDASSQLAANYTFCSFGVAWGDVDNDGFLDLMVANCKNNTNASEKSNSLLINQGNDNNWLKIKLIGFQSNKNAIGAKIRVKAIIDENEVWQIREIRSQSGYAGQNSMIAHFGLGNATAVDSLIIQWPAGGTQILEGINSNQQMTIEEDFANNATEQDLQKTVSFEIYPNPVSHTQSEIQISFQSTIAAEGEILIADTLGRMILKKSVNFGIGKSELNFSLTDVQLASGIYQVVLQIGQERMSRKLVVK